jgi:hypothetical protein
MVTMRNLEVMCNFAVVKLTRMYTTKSCIRSKIILSFSIFLHAYEAKYGSEVIPKTSLFKDFENVISGQHNKILTLSSRIPPSAAPNLSRIMLDHI